MTSDQGLFFYFLPGQSAASINRATLAKCPFASSLGEALRTDRLFDAMVVANDVSVGPNGSSGALVVVHHPDWPDSHRLGYYPDEQTWRDCGGFWLGYVTNMPPGPDSLQRDPLVSGYDYELGDERIWHAPLIRHPGGAANLPKTMGVNASGAYIESVVPSLEWAWELSRKIWDEYFLGEGISRAEVFGLAVKCLGLNYRIGPHEATALRLFDSENAALVLKAAIAEPLIREFMAAEESKKNQAVAVP